MIVEQIYTSCLSQGSYYIESNNEVAIIDPIREIDSYIKRAEKTGSKIKYIFETHLHADFISGHVTLAKKTGADIVFGPDVETSFNKLSAKDGQEFKIGDIKIVSIQFFQRHLNSILEMNNSKDIWQYYNIISE